ncbi:MAG: elongation factor P [Desulfohalobiaceae bacterium]|nr:elongation factor P [Desulfohalobiaceae bacterium]
MYSTSDIKNGLKIEMDGQPFEVLEFLHSKSGRGGAHIKTKLKNLINGSVLDHTFRSGEKIAKPDLEAKDMQYLYRESDKFVFMDMTTYEQVFVDQSALGSKGAFLQEGQEIKVLTFKEQVIDVQLPAAVIMEVAETEPGVKGDTVSGTTKPAKMENGLSVNVPLFIDQGERIKVDTRSGEYLGRE